MTVYTVLIVQLMSVIVPLCIYGNTMQVYNDQTIRTIPFSCLKEFSWNQCMMECLYVTMCKSFSFKNETRECILYHKTISDGISLKANMTGYTWSDATEITKVVGSGDTCASRPCNLNQRCYPTTQYTCRDVDCGKPRIKGSLPTDTYVLPGNTSIGSSRGYYCNSERTNAHWFGIFSGATDCQKNSVSYCMSNYQWADLKLSCNGRSTVYDCQSVRACSRNYGDGHYWVYKNGLYNLPMKVFCHNMSTQPVMYLSLSSSDENYAGSAWFENVVNNVGTIARQLTRFLKVRIENSVIPGNRISVLKIVLDDFEFSTSSDPNWRVIPFGTAGGCESLNSQYGWFNIDLTGTTFKLTANNSWTSSSKSYTIDPLVVTDYTVNGLCSTQECGVLCTPNGELTIEVVENHGVPESSATVPVCP